MPSAVSSSRSSRAIPAVRPARGRGRPSGGLDGIGATPHTIFSAAPKSGGSPKSHAVAATWGFDKVRSHYMQASTQSAGSTPGAGASADNPVLAFASQLCRSLTGDGSLQGAYAATLRDFAGGVYLQVAG